MAKKESVPAVRVHLFYAGRVQGVGFRYTAERFALELGLVGWVKNLPDGRVELLCEGSREKIDVLLEKIRLDLGANIQKTTCRWETPTHEFKDFGIEFAV